MMDFDTLAQHFGLPAAMLGYALLAIMKKWWVPGWYITEKDEYIAKLEEKLAKAEQLLEEAGQNQGRALIVAEKGLDK